MILSVMWKDVSNNGDVDNPDDDFLAKFIPANVGNIVFTTQIVTLLAYVIFADSSMLDITLAVGLFPRRSQADPDDKTTCMVLSCILRGIQGILATIAVLLTVITSNTVMEIILNYAAISFISHLDDNALS